eukprot:7497459-Alexandrium_andersonii.AAC.1
MPCFRLNSGTVSFLRPQNSSQLRTGTSWQRGMSRPSASVASSFRRCPSAVRGSGRCAGAGPLRRLTRTG